MKKISMLALALLLCGCERNFNQLMIEARKASAENNHTVVIDNINLAIPRWRDRDGTDQKSEAYELLGKSYHALKKIDQAIDSYQQAIKLSNNAYHAAYELGVIHTAGFQHEMAKEAFQAALRMRKDDPVALVGLGDSLYSLGRYSEAKAVYQRVINVSPGVSNALANLRLVDQKLAARRMRTRSKR